MPKHNKNIQNILLFILSFTIGIFLMSYYFVFFHDVEERQFLKNVRSAYNEEKAMVPIKSVTNFSWDKVCLIDNYDLLTQQSSLNTERIFGGSLPKDLRMPSTGSFFVALSFSRNDIVSKVLFFKASSIGKGGLQPHKVNFKEDQYNFLASKKGSRCRSIDEAYFEAVTTETACCGQEREIIFTSKKGN